MLSDVVSDTESVDFDCLNDEDSALFDRDNAEASYDEDEGTSGEHSQREQSGRNRLPVNRATCPKCGRLFKTFEGYKTHLKVHIMEEVYLSGPGREAFVEECRRSSKDVIQSIHELASKLSGRGGEVMELATFLISLIDDTRNIFIDKVASELWACIPAPSTVPISKFHAAYIQCSNHLMNDPDRRDSMLFCLYELAPFVPDSVIKLFFGHFFLKFSEKMEAFYLKSLRESHESIIFSTTDPKTRSGDDAEDIEFQQSVHYIGGSVVRSILKVGLQSSTPKWVKIVTCITTRVLVGSLSTAPSRDISEWTESRDRGGLKYISQEMWTFLMALSGVLKSVEQRDGSVLQEAVLQAVCGDEVIMMLWDDVVGDSLSEEEKNFLVKEVCRLFVNTWGKGVALRLKNAIPKVSRDKAPLRMSVLRN